MEISVLVTPKNPAPEISGKRRTRQERDGAQGPSIGLVCFPSAWKSTLLSVITAAASRSGAYHFTTIVPNLGMVRTQSTESFAVADLPFDRVGHKVDRQFLRHIERLMEVHSSCYRYVSE